MATSGKVVLWEGKVLLDGGKVGLHEHCCPCDCEHDEPNATVSGIVGACAGTNGEHLFHRMVKGDDACQFVLQLNGGDNLVLTYCRSEDNWCAWLPSAIDGFGADTCDCGVDGAEVPQLECVDGNIQGTFTLIGHGNCEGATATVVVS